MILSDHSLASRSWIFYDLKQKQTLVIPGSNALFFLIRVYFSSFWKEAGAGWDAGRTRWPDHTLTSRTWGSRLENGDAILIGDGACRRVQGCPRFVSQRKGCQELSDTVGMSPWPCLSAGEGEEGWERRPPVPLTLRSTLCHSTANLLGHIPTHRQAQWHSETDRPGADCMAEHKNH